MNDVLAVFDSVIGFLRIGFFALAATLSVVCAIDWAVRTRRINPFGKVARFFRQAVDPAMMPVERRIVRAGGAPSTAPWWALVVVVLAGIVAISGLQFIRDQVVTALLASSNGPRGIAVVAITWAFAILQIALIVRVFSSWTSISPYSAWVRWSYVLSDPILRPLQRIIPTLGKIDISPIVAYFLLQLIQSQLLRVV